MTLPSVSIITTCKGRLHHLRETIHSMLAQDYAGEWEIVVVDYDCPDGTFAWVKSLDHPRVHCVKVRDTLHPWSMAHARNVGAQFANGQVLAFIDADNHPDPEYLTTGVNALRESGESLCLPVSADGNYAGACFVTSAAFHAARGNDEQLTDYGVEDIDFYNRLGAEGRSQYRFQPRCTIPQALLRLIHHEDGERLQFCASQNLQESLDHNRSLARDTSRAVNFERYGQTRDYDTWGPIYPPAIRDLRRRHPWPAVAPDLPFNPHGWMGEGNRRLVQRLLTELQPKCIIEVGSWLGLSARFMLEHSTAHVVSIDLWDHAVVGEGMLREAGLSDARTLWEQFVANQLACGCRDRLTPVRANTVAGLWLARDAGLNPDLIYIDASHERAHFEADLATAARCFPAATLCGDDWGWGGPGGYTIRPAVTALAAQRGQRVEVDGECWVIAP